MDYSAFSSSDVSINLEPSLNPFVIIPKFFYLMTVTSEFAILGTIFFALSMAMAYIIWKGLPFT